MQLLEITFWTFLCAGIAFFVFRLFLAGAAGPGSKNSRRHSIRARAAGPGSKVSQRHSIQALGGLALVAGLGVAGSGLLREPPHLTASDRIQEIVLCRPANQQLTRASCNKWREDWDKLEIGLGGFLAPSTMTRGDTKAVTFVLSEERRPERVAELLGRTPDRIFETKVGGEMGVELTGEGFNIKPEGIQVKDFVSGQKWEWKITALRASDHELDLSVYVVMAAPSGSQRQSLHKTITQQIFVEVTPAQRTIDFFDDATVWLTSGTTFLKALKAFMVAALALISVLVGRRILSRT